MDKSNGILTLKESEERKRRDRRRRQIEAVSVLVFLLVAMLVGLLSACNVTRTVTTSAQHIQRGDTTTTIMTKTIESYDGKVDATKLLNK